MYSALLYPHMRFDPDKQPSLLKRALLVWDQLETIAPVANRGAPHPNKTVKRALDLVVGTHRPTAEEKDAAHATILELAKSKLPDWFLFKTVDPKLRASIHPEKLLAETWIELERSKLAERHGQSFIAASSLAFTVMAILADCCAGKQKFVLTDQLESHAALHRWWATVGGTGYQLQHSAGDDQARLVTISVQTISPKGIPLSRLVKLRERESNEPQLRERRHRFTNFVNDHVETIRTKARHASDVKELERVFEQRIADDHHALLDDLKVEAKKALLSNEMAIGVAALPGMLLDYGLLSGPLGVAALVKKKIEYKASRNKTLDGHPSAWLYSTKRIAVW
jgi:hypothetical protein